MATRHWTLLAAIVVLAACLRLVGLDSPSMMVVDEFWYARDGCYYWLGSSERCSLATLIAPDRDVQSLLREYGELTPEHPPLAKWLIGAPVEAIGFGPRPWRLAAVLAGTLTVALLFLIVRRAFASTAAAVGSAVLLAIDYPHFIHSRLAMLDIFVALFALAAFYFCLLDRLQLEARLAGAASHQRWRLAAGAAAGAAAACKLSGAAVAVGVVALISWWEIAGRRRSAQLSARYHRTAGSIALLLVAVPLVVYIATYAGRIDGSLLAWPWAEGSWPRAWVERQALIVDLQADKPSTSASSLTLPMTERPLPYVLDQGSRSVRELLLFGNPLLWWGGFLAVAFTALRCVRGDRFGLAPLILIGFLSAYAGWLSLTLTGTQVYLYHAVPVAPFLYLALAYVYVQVATSRAARVGGSAVIVASVGAFAFYYPILTARQLEYDQWRPRACSALALWLDPQPRCGLPLSAPRAGSDAAAAPSIRRSD